MISVSRAVTTSRIVVLLYGLGLLGQMVLPSLPAPPQSTEALRDSLGFRLGTLASVTGCAVLVLAPLSSGSRWRAISTAVVVGWQLVLTGAGVLSAPAEAPLTLGDHATRLAAPLALFWLVEIYGQGASGQGVSPPTPTTRDPRERVLNGLCAASAAMFFVHGWKVLQDPQAQALLTRSLGRWNGYALAPGSEQLVLWMITAADWIAATLVLVGVRRPALCYMALWGMMTALSRISAYGLFAWDEAFLRATNGGVALIALFLLPTREPPRDESRLH